MISRPGLATLGLLICFPALAASNDLSQAEIQGRQLARQLTEQWPATNLVQTGILRIRGPKSRRLEIPVTCEVVILPAAWQSIYTVVTNNSAGLSGAVKLTVTHSDGENQYQARLDSGAAARWSGGGTLTPDAAGLVPGKEVMIPFAGSDFAIGDLGLEFFHWPGQKILKHEMRRGRACRVLESTNPAPPANGYSRVVSWIDNESGGIVQAEAYDANGKLLKEFEPKSFKKVNGQWELQEMEIDNDQTGSRTWLEFDLKRK